MRTGTSSRTAAFVAVMRGLGRFLPPSLRLADDPYGAAFGGPTLRWLAEATPERSGRIVLGLPGVRYWVLYMQVRTRVLDDIVRDFVDEVGADRAQVVLLGAGFDCRALRLPALRGVPVYEVDHPDTQRHKLAVLARIGAASPARSLAWDFERASTSELPAALAALGLDPDRPTLTLWEGVTMYLTEAAIDRSVAAIRAYSGPRSELAMTYHRGDHAGASDAQKAAAAATSRLVANLGEPWRWSLPPGALPGWAEARGFDVVRDTSATEAARALLPADAVAWGPGATALLRVR